MKKILIITVILAILLGSFASAGVFEFVTGMPVLDPDGDGCRDSISCNFRQALAGGVCPENCVVEQQAEADEDCTDTDGGIVLDAYGTATGNYGVAGIGSYSDRCIPAGPYVGQLVEYFCLGGLVQFHRYDCPEGMSCDAGECVVGEELFVGGINGAVALGEALISVFDGELQDDEISALDDGEITFQGQNYDTSEELQLDSYYFTSVKTSITSSDDDYESNVALESFRDAIRYAYKFDESIDLTTATMAEPLVLEILGTEFEISSVSANQIVTNYGTFNNGDPYYGEDPNDPDWVWYLIHLDVFGTDQLLAVENDFYHNDWNEAVKVGDCLGLPNDYVEICFDELTVDDADYATFTIEIDQDLDVSDIFPGMDSLDALYVHTDLIEGIELPVYDQGGIANDYFNAITGDVWLYYDDNTNTAIDGSGSGQYVDVFYTDPSNPSDIQWHGSVSAEVVRDILSVDYEDTTGSDIVLQTTELGIDELVLQYHMIPANTSNAEDLIMTWGTSGVIQGLGDTPNLEESSELVLDRAYDYDPSLGTKDEDHRLAYGVVLKDPKSRGASDEVEIEVPNDQVYARVTIIG